MEVKVVLDEGAKMPTKAHEEDAGFDLYSPIDVRVGAFGSATIDTGVHIQIPLGYTGFIKSKSGLNVNHDLQAEGVIDCGYTGTIRVKIYNRGNKSYEFKAGEKLTQLVLLPIPKVDLVQVKSIENTARGTDGFGSSGK